ncbi:LptM family lipoprotein [Thalassobacillus hwangdonensis]|uniref:Lipoprotein n=1 Tax=Thalassobacillus hwangdonensis TaxID=546108 RepID=A0ABW3L6J1_9BACI
MKKIIIAMLLVVFSIVLAACGQDESASTDKKAASSEKEHAENTQLKPEDIEISEDVKKMSYETIKGYDGVKDAYIEVDGGKILMTLQVGASMNEETRKEMGDNFVRNLASNAAIYNDDLDGPSKDAYGTLFEVYDLQIGVGTGSDDITQGAKVKESPKITW